MIQKYLINSKDAPEDMSGIDKFYYCESNPNSFLCKVDGLKIRIHFCIDTMDVFVDTEGETHGYDELYDFFESMSKYSNKLGFDFIFIKGNLIEWLSDRKMISKVKTPAKTNLVGELYIDGYFNVLRNI